ncbi:hypothetical protein VVR12_01710 [Rothia sp. LK2588]|uniref:hypothetical protein n=1 Tax=Rothia sp. LK2588 TaxID=3114369 RepID=UPI0034CD45D2
MRANRARAPKPTRANIYTYTDPYGDTLEVVPTGDGGIQWEITPKDGPTYEVRMPRKIATSELMRLFRKAVDATGQTPDEIKKDFRKAHKLPPQRVTLPGSSFGKTTKES